ncbi:hypothetical protein EON81_15190 [bacterium]|nr:MAG: hypothetical protein EON81_15190 [bacterium]
MAAVVSAQTPTWAKAHTSFGALRTYNGTKGFASFTDPYDVRQFRAYDLLNGKFTSTAILNMSSLPYSNIDTSDNGARFLLHNSGVDFPDFVYYKVGDTVVANSLPHVRLDEFSMEMHATTKMTHDGNYVLQLWANGQSDWYQASSGNLIGSGSGPILEVADGKAVTDDGFGFLRSVNLATGVQTAFPFSVQKFLSPIAGRNNLLVAKGSFNGNYYAVNLTTGVQTALNFQAGDQVAGVFADGKTIAINNPSTKKGYVQKIGSARKLISTSIEVAPDGTRALLAKNGILRPIYNHGNDTSFTIEETSYAPFGFDSSNRPILNLDNSVLRTLDNSGAPVANKTLPVLPTGATVQFISKDIKTLVYRTGTFLRRIDLTTNADTAWLNTAVVSDWDVIYGEDGKSALIYQENPVNHMIEVNYVYPSGDSVACYLPVGTKVRGLAPNGRMIATQASGGKAWVRFYDPTTGVLKKSLSGGTGEPSENFGWSSDGNTVAMQMLSDFRLIDVNTGVVRKIGGQANNLVDMTGSDTAISLSHDGSLMSFGPKVFKTSNYKLMLTVPNSQFGKGIFSNDNLSFVYQGEMATERFALPVTP